MRKLLIIAMLAFAFVACKEDKDDVTFIGDWQCDESSQVYGRQLFNVKIAAKGTSKTDVTIANFYQLGFNDLLGATVSGNYITIPSQYFCDLYVSGQGEMDSKGTTINWRYVVSGAGKVDSCTAIYTRK